MKLTYATLLVLCSSFLTTNAVHAQPGTLDPSFGTGGIVTTDFALGGEDQAEAMALQPDGRIVLVGWVGDALASVFAVARYNPDGTLDTSFDGDGKLTTSINGIDFARGVAIQADGKIVVVGYTTSMGSQDFVVVRYNVDGTLDNTFSGDGIEVTSVGLDEWAYGVALQPDGKILAVGAAYTPTALDFALVRFNTDGSLDTTFSGDGKVTADFAGAADQAHLVRVQPDGRIVVCGGTQIGMNWDFGAARFNTDGTPDLSFDGDGRVSTSIGADYDFAIAGGIQADGRIIAASTSLNSGGGSDYDYALVRYNTDGSLDGTFDGDGKVTTSIGTYWDEGRGLAVQPDGRILLAGFSLGEGISLVRYNTDGTLDSDFDTDGRVTTSIGGISDKGTCIALQSNGKILVGGLAYVGGSVDFALVRYGKTLENSVDEHALVSEAMVLYPDPTSDFATLCYTLSSATALSLDIVDATGRNVRTMFSNGTLAAGKQKQVLDLSDLAPGNYVLVLSNGRQSATVKCVKE